jgi:predicted branched-subunit amino acid permease
MDHAPQTTTETTESGTTLRWFMRGARAGLSVPGLILASAFIGFGSLAREEGFSLVEVSFMTLTVWALPAVVVLIGAIKSGATIVGAAVVVALSSVRLMPMVVALVPEMRTPHTRTWVLYLLSHFVAVTSWVMAFQRFPGVPREMRTAFYGGLALWLMIANLAVVAIVYSLAARLPPTASAALLLLTPIYFLTSLWGSARESAGRLALAIGVVLGPVIHLLAPGFDLPATGLIGGGLAYVLYRMNRDAAA